jgi:hypothetical protein
MRAFPKPLTPYLKKIGKYVKRLFGKAHILRVSPCATNGSVPLCCLFTTAAFRPGLTKKTGRRHASRLAAKPLPLGSPYASVHAFRQAGCGADVLQRGQGGETIGAWLAWTFA